MVTATKTCNRCKRELSLDMFKSDRSKKDGLYTLCKDCTKAYRDANKDKIKARKKEYRLRPEAKKLEKEYAKYRAAAYKVHIKDVARRYRQRRREQGDPIKNKPRD
jgi:septal ring factor EnvC (AmiA/AmiB activator)